MGTEVKNKSVPKLRFREFEGKWNNYRLGDVCHVAHLRSSKVAVLLVVVQT